MKRFAIRVVLHILLIVLLSIGSYLLFQKQLWFSTTICMILLIITAVHLYRMQLQSPNQKIPDRKTKCVIETHLNIKQNVIFGANLKPV